MPVSPNQKAPTPVTTSSSSSATSFNPNAAAVTTSTTGSVAGLPAGLYDYTNMTEIANQNLFAGTVQSEVGGVSTAPTYNTVPQYSTALKTLQSYISMANTDATGFSNIQAQLYEAHYYGDTAPVFGQFGTGTGDALGSAMKDYLSAEHANSTNGLAPQTFSEWLAAQAQAGQAQGGPGSSGTGTTSKAPITVTDPATLEADANTSAQTNLGRNLSSAEQQPFVKDFQNQEVAAQEAGAGTVTAEPSRYDAPNAATQYIQTNDNAEYQNHLQADYAERMLSMFGVQSS